MIYKIALIFFLLFALSAMGAVPVADHNNITTNEDTPVSFTLTGSDADSDPLVYYITTKPVHGANSVGTPPTYADRTYTPTANYNGTDKFYFWAWDGTNYSAIQTIDINIAPVDDAPILTYLVDIYVSIPAGSGPTVKTYDLNYAVLQGDVDGQTSFTYSVEAGTLPAFASLDSGGVLTFTVDDGNLGTCADVNFTVTDNTDNHLATSKKVSVIVRNTATYYVDDVNGNDSTGNGSSGSPWKTIGRAKTYYAGSPYVHGGDTVRIRPSTNTYSGVRWIDFHNKDQDWITYEASDPNDRPILPFICMKWSDNTDRDAHLIFDGFILPAGAAIEAARIAADTSAITANCVKHFKLKNIVADGNYASNVVYMSNGGKAMTPTDIMIEDCNFSRGRVTVAILGANDVNIVNSTFFDGSDGVFISVDTNNVRVSHTTIHRPYAKDPNDHVDLVQIYASSQYTPCTNWTWDSCKIYTEVPGISQGFFIKNAKDWTLKNCLIYGPFLVNPFIFHTHCMGTITVTNCTIAVTSTGGFTSSEIDKVIFNNNIFLGGLSVDNGFGSVFTAKNCIIDKLYFGSEVPAPDATNYIYGHYPLTAGEKAALFTSPDTNDYTLKAASLAINFGDASLDPVTDIVDMTRDANSHSAGAYEYTGEAPENHAPVLAAIGNKTILEGCVLSFVISATDEDEEDELTYDGGGPTGSTFVEQTFTWRPSYYQAGSYAVSFSVTDGEEWDYETIDITVTDVPQYFIGWKKP